MVVEDPKLDSHRNEALNKWYYTFTVIGTCTCNTNYKCNIMLFSLLWYFLFL